MQTRDAKADNTNQIDAPDGFYRASDVIAGKTALANKDIPDKIGEARSEQTWEAISGLAWRPAWSIRSRRGTLGLLLQWWRNRRHDL